MSAQLTDEQLGQIATLGNEARILAHEIRQLRAFTAWLQKGFDESEAREVGETPPRVILQAPGTDVAPVTLAGEALNHAQCATFDMMTVKHERLTVVMGELKQLAGGKRRP